jgi:hypothetical protein
MSENELKKTQQELNAKLKLIEQCDQLKAENEVLKRTLIYLLSEDVHMPLFYFTGYITHILNEVTK